MTKDRTVTCSSCRAHMAAADWLGGGRQALVGLGLAVTPVAHLCPRCAAESMMLVEDDGIALGYLYGAGAAHFSAEQRIEIPGLRVSTTSDGLRAELDGETWIWPRDSRPPCRRCNAVRRGTIADLEAYYRRAGEMRDMSSERRLEVLDASAPLDEVLSDRRLAAGTLRHLFACKSCGRRFTMQLDAERGTGSIVEQD